MRVAVLDADLIGRKRHRFPNLACMKISRYHKEHGDSVVLKTDYDGLEAFGCVYLSKVFTDTDVPDTVLKSQNVSCGGTGFFYDKAPALPKEVEHQTPDYHLYDGWVTGQTAMGRNPKEFAYYRDYSIGFLTRGCFRRCAFCVNRNYNAVAPHSPLHEFFDPERRKICLLDDNFFGCAGWKEMLDELKLTRRPFQFKQGLDGRLLTKEKCAMIFCPQYDGDYIFAFDDVSDAAIVKEKIGLARKYTNAVMKFYCFCGFDRADVWDADFWRQDVFDLMTRIEILMQNRCLPYVMRYARYKESPYRGVYISIARWCNQPNFYKKKSLREFAVSNGENSACYRYLSDFEKRFPEVAHFYDMRFE